MPVVSSRNGSNARTSIAGNGRIASATATDESAWLEGTYSEWDSAAPVGLMRPSNIDAGNETCVPGWLCCAA